MAFLKPDAVRTELGLTIKERIIPDSARATRDVAPYVPRGGPMKPCRRLSDGSGRAQWITIHNTGNIRQATGTSAAEQYSRATWPNQAMGGVVVHYYVDEEEAWQNLREDEQGWHAADGFGPGNTTSIAVEIIMDGSGSQEDVAAERNGAKLAACLLRRHGLGIDRLTTHQRWSGKYCPAYILPHWTRFVEMVRGYLGEEGTAGYTRICGEAVATAGQMRAYLRLKNPDAPDYAAIYLEEGAAEGVRGDVAFAQACVETGYWRFGGDVLPEQNNFAGIGATGGGAAGSSFPSPRIGIRAQVQHLKCYASAEPLAGVCVDPRWGDWLRGKAPYVEWLGQQENPEHIGWASGAGYGDAILQALEEILSVDVPQENDLVARYEELWKRYDAKTAGEKKLAAAAQHVADAARALAEDV